MALERELKFSLLEPYVPALAELRSALEDTPFDATSAGSEDLLDLYFDDEPGSLRRAGWALRRRRQGGRAWATLKASGEVDGAYHRREELEAPLPGGADDGAWPAELTGRLTALVDPAALRPRLELRSTRVRFRISAGDREAGVLSFDAVDARVPGGERSALFDEVEVEAEAGTSEAELRAIGDAVERLVRLSPSTVSKLERAEALLSLADW